MIVAQIICIQIIMIMNKEEQQQNQYRILLQRNQFNAEVIRKYRKKSNNYHKKIAQLGPPNTHPIQPQPQTGNNQVEFTQYVENQQGKDKGMALQEQCIVAEWIKSDMVVASKSREGVRLPSINATVKEDSASKSKRNRFQFRTEVSMSIGCVPYEKKVKTNTEINQKCDDYNAVKPSGPAPTCPTFDHSAASLATKTKSQIPNLTHSVRHTTIQSSQPQSYTSVAHHHKKQARNSNSHKTLLNLQEIVFEATAKRSGANNNSKHISDDKQTYKQEECYRNDRRYSKQKRNKNVRMLQKMDDKQNMLQLCHSYNNYGQEPAKDGLQNLTNLINREITQNKAGNNNNNTNNNNAVSSIALSALSALSAMNTNTTNLTMEKTPKYNTNLNSEGTNAQYCLTSIQKHAKLALPLPQIHKLKQFRMNFQRMLRKDQQQQLQQSVTCTNKANTNTNVNPGIPQIIHNHSYSLNSISELTEKDKNIFKVQAIPVHFIKWM